MSVAWLAAWGCYSSNAVPPNVEPADPKDGNDLPIEGQDACATRKLWEGPGITAVLPILGTQTAYVISGDRYAIAEFDLTNKDAPDQNTGRVLGWHESGLLRDLWANAPPAIGGRPWDGPGVTAAYIDKSNAQIIISEYRRWVLNGGAWTKQGSIQDDLGAGNAAPPVEDGGSAPWTGVGVTAATISTDGTTFSLFSRDRLWIRAVGDPDESKWVWLGNGPVMVANVKPWVDAQPVNGKRPSDDKGITAAIFFGRTLLSFSTDKLWVSNADGTMVRSALLSDPAQQDWKTAPVVACP